VYTHFPEENVSSFFVLAFGDAYGADLSSLVLSNLGNLASRTTHKKYMRAIQKLLKPAYFSTFFISSGP